MYKIAKGTTDLVGEDYRRVQKLILTAQRLFEENGGVALETPVFERTDVLLGKYGEEAESKLIYKLEDQGGDDLSLRYDLTIPFVRYVKENRIKKMRRYAIGKVYRRDQPKLNQGRFREFYQADFDIMGGNQDGMLTEATLLNIVNEFMKANCLEFKILINDVQNLRALLETRLGIKEWRKITPIIDKLDKVSFDELREEFLSVDPTIDLDALQASIISPEPYYPETADSFKQLKEYADIMGFGDRLVFTNSLARGLDYYTGFIWEVKIDGVESSVSAGGRYDTLLNTPSAGISFGISRLAALIDWTVFDTPVNNDCFVTSVGAVSVADKLRVVKQLRESGKYGAILYDMCVESRKLKKVMSDVAADGIGYLAIVGTEDVIIRNMITRDEVCIRN